MPNWSTSDIELTGSKDVVEELYNDISVHGLNVLKTKLSDNPTTREAVESYGTKWDMLAPDTVEEGMVTHDGVGELNIYQCFPWKGPDEWFRTVTYERTLSGKYVDYEPGVGFVHVIKAKDGVTISDVEDDLVSRLGVKEINRDEFLETVPSMITTMEEFRNIATELTPEEVNSLTNSSDASEFLASLSDVSVSIIDE